MTMLYPLVAYRWHVLFILLLYFVLFSTTFVVSSQKKVQDVIGTNGEIFLRHDFVNYFQVICPCLPQFSSDIPLFEESSLF